MSTLLAERFFGVVHGGAFNWVALLVAVATIAACSVSYLSSRTQKEEEETPSSSSWKTVSDRRFLTGHFHLIGGIRDMADRLEEWSERYGKESGCFQFYMMRRPFVVICSEERLMEIAKYRPYQVQRSVKIRESVKSLGASGLFAAEGETWKREHKLVSAALNKSNVQDYMPMMKKMAARLINKWSTECARGAIAITNDLGNISADSISNVAMGQDFDFLHSTRGESGGTDILTAMSGLSKRAVSPFWYWRIPVVGPYLDASGVPARRVHQLISRVVEQCETPGDDQSGKTFLQKLYTVMKSENSSLKQERVVGNVLTLFVAGTDTTSKTLVTSLYLLAKDSALQQELRNEADKVDLDASSITLHDLYEKLPRLKSFLHEVHRMYGVPFIGLQPAKDIPFAGTVLHKGTTVYIAMRYISMYATKHAVPGPNGESPDLFCAKRFLQRDETGKLSCPDPDNKAGAFLGFGFGVRKCPGRTYSEAFSYLVLASMLKTFTWELESNHPEVRIHLNVTMSPDCDVQLNMTKRE
jgi:cytochrome P450